MVFIQVAVGLLLLASAAEVTPMHDDVVNDQAAGWRLYLPALAEGNQLPLSRLQYSDRHVLVKFRRSSSHADIDRVHAQIGAEE